MYLARKQADGTYSIYERNSIDPVLTNVRGCNVGRVLNRLYLDDLKQE